MIGVAEANYKSGAIASHETFTYGKFVAKMKNPNKKGTVASFYTFWDGPGFYPGGWNEIDINVVPSVENPVSLNTIYGNGHSKLEDHSYQDFNLDDDWHIYEMEWTPNYISFAIDGREVRHLDGRDHQSVRYMHRDQSLKMNFWTPTFHSWGQDFNDVNMPWYLLVDYVEAYSYNKDSNSFDFAWRDEFDFFDNHRWKKTTGTFQSSSSMFSPSNVYTNDGNLIIKMEPEWHHHYGDLVHPAPIGDLDVFRGKEGVPHADLPEFNPYPDLDWTGSSLSHYPTPTHHSTMTRMPYRYTPHPMSQHLQPSTHFATHPAYSQP